MGYPPRWRHRLQILLALGGGCVLGLLAEPVPEPGGTCLLHRSLYLTSGGTQPPVGRASLARGSHPKGKKRSRCPRRPPCPGLAVAEVAPARHRSDLRRGREVALFTFQRPECPPVLPGGRVASRSCRDAELTRPPLLSQPGG